MKRVDECEVDILIATGCMIGWVLCILVVVAVRWLS